MGIDPSLNSTGLALADGTLMTLKQKPADGDYRLTKIRCAFISAIGHPNRPALVAMEDLPRNAMGAGITGQVQGVLREVMQDYKIPYLLVSAATLKKFATNNGRADKSMMRQAWLEMTGEDNPRDDEVDAAWLRTMGLYLTQSNCPSPHEDDRWEAAVTNLRPAFDKLHLGAQQWIRSA